METGEHLCLACGLCCDGSLFDYVRLSPGDNPPALRALGLPVSASRGSAAPAHLRQPCAALCADRACRVYADRPAQCRTFECGVYKHAQVGRIKPATAMRLVRQARKRADTVRQLLRALGDHDEARSLSERFARMQRRMASGAADAATAETFGELGVAMHRFKLLAHERFYTPADQP